MGGAGVVWVTDQAGDGVGVEVVLAGFVLDVKVVLLQPESPSGEARGHAAGDGLLHGVQPLEGGVVGDELELAAPKVGAEMLDGFDHRQEFALGDGVVPLGFAESAAVVGHDTFGAVVVELFETCAHAYASGGVGSHDEGSVGPRVHQDGIGGEGVDEVADGLLSGGLLGLGGDVDAGSGEVDEGRGEDVEVVDVIAVVAG